MYLTKVELKHNTLFTIITSLFIIAICFVVFGIDNLDVLMANYAIERFLPLMGIISISSTYYPEQLSPIKDLLKLRDNALCRIYVVRSIIRFIIFAVITYIYVQLIYTPTNVYTLHQAWLHSMSIGLFVGGFGLLLFSITNNIVISYLVTIIYMFLQWFIKKDVLGFFYLYNLDSLSVTKIMILFLTGLFLVIISIPLWNKRSVN